MNGHEAFVAASHERARELAAARIDELLPPGDEAWLADHLEGCAACVAVAAEYDAHHDLFSALREATPQPPRDLWARTSAAIDAERGRSSRAWRWRRLRGSPGRSTRLALAPMVAVLAVVVVVGAGLLNGRPIAPSGTAGAATPIAITGAADLQVLSLDSAGNLQILSRRVDQVCPTGVAACGVSPTFAVTAVSAFGSATDLLGAISPTGGQMVVVRRDPGSQGVYVVPVKQPAASPAATRSTGPATTSTAPNPASPTTVRSSSGAASPSHTARTASVPPASPKDGPSSPRTSPEPSPAASGSATESPVPSGGAAASSPSDGSASASSSPSASPAATAEPSVEVTPAPDGAIRIASGVVVVGTPTYSPDGSHLAFAAMPADASSGPDIYVWAVGDTAAQAITTDHDSWLAGWTGQGILLSRVDDGLPTTYELDPSTGFSTAIGAPGTWLPSISPTGTTAAWWSGTVRLAADGLTWVPDQGQLVLGAWPSTGMVLPSPQAPGSSPSTDVPSASLQAPSWWPSIATASSSPQPPASWQSTETASASSEVPGASPSTAVAPAPPQVLANGPLDAWQVRWDNTGAAVAVWQGQDDGQNGRLSLYGVDTTTGVPDLANPMLAATAANPDFSLRAGRLAWTVPGQGATQTVDVLAWSGTTVYPTMELSADGTGTLVP